MSAVSLGTCVAISSAVIYALEKGTDDGLKMSLEEASWIREMKRRKSPSIYHEKLLSI